MNILWKIEAHSSRFVVRDMVEIVVGQNRVFNQTCIVKTTINLLTKPTQALTDTFYDVAVRLGESEPNETLAFGNNNMHNQCVQ